MRDTGLSRSPTPRRTPFDEDRFDPPVPTVGVPSYWQSTTLGSLWPERSSTAIQQLRRCSVVPWNPSRWKHSSLRSQFSAFTPPLTSG